MTDPQFTLVAGVIGTIFGGAIGAFGTYLGAVRIARKNNERMAAKRLREAFAPALGTLKNPFFSTSEDIHEILLSAFHKHRTAVINFRYFVPSCCKAGFDKAWHNYYAHDDTNEETTEEYLLKYAPGWVQKPPKECRDLAIKNIEELLKFAKHK